MSVRERMKQYLKTITVSEGYFEKECGLSNGYVSKIGDSIRTSILKKIEDKHQQLNISWLLTGEGEMLKSNQTVSLSAKEPDEIQKLKNEIEYLKQTIQDKEKIIELYEKMMGK